MAIILRNRCPACLSQPEEGEGNAIREERARTCAQLFEGAIRAEAAVLDDDVFGAEPTRREAARAASHAALRSIDCPLETPQIDENIERALKGQKAQHGN